MKLPNYPENLPAGAGFDNAGRGLMLLWMRPFGLKAFRNFAAAATLFVAGVGEAFAAEPASTEAANNAPAATETTTNATPVITKEIPPARPANLNISAATEKVIKLAESNLDENVILTFVQQTPGKFDLDADEIVYLSDVGVPSSVIAAMLKHDGDDPAKAEAIASAKIEDAQPAIPAVTNTFPTTAEPQPPALVEVTTNYIPNQQIVVQ
jgi:hypothetical protein